ncbi:MAG: mechanosensitive ion channel family protein [Acidobacteria bacterium]|nr:MAG: mechanosensitive ion channel family protein [Acidobacteriota bacterium]REK11098.1 MAG: mechanosensitive ion channel family protein [Acidobacteriota bacterium]
MKELISSVTTDLTEWVAGLGVATEWTDAAATALLYLGLLAVAMLGHYVARFLLTRVAAAAADRTQTTWDDAFVDAGVLRRIAHLVPALIIQRGSRELLSQYEDLVGGIDALISAYLVLIAVLVVEALLTAVHTIYDSRGTTHRFEIKTVIQVAKLISFSLGAVVIVALLMGRSPVVLLSGLGAFTAILMLIFRDAILGFVAGIQLSVNNMVRRGDWIEMPSHGADGDVIDVSLTTVKVQNWDKTITTIPTYALVSESFKNWRGMSESGGRRIKRALYLDVHSIRFCDRETIDRYLKIAHIRDYVVRLHDEVTEHNRERGFDSSDLTDLINGRHLTNVGTFRAYVEAYLRDHPKIHQEMTLMVRQLAPTEHGLPLEIYAFCNDQRWAVYEAAQADIFDHLLAVAPLFDLRIFQAPSGGDVRGVGERMAAARDQQEGDASGSDD